MGEQRGPVWPLMRGDWRPLSGDEPAQFVERLDVMVARTHVSEPPFHRRAPLRALRALALSFYPGWMVVEGEAELADDLIGTFDVLYGPRFIGLLDGRSALLHTLNGGRLPIERDEDADGKPDFLPGPLAPIDATTAADYLRFFCGAVWGDEGPFRLVESLDDPDLAEVEGDSPTWREQVQPLAVQATDDGFEVAGLVCYGQSLFKARFRIAGGGLVEMLDDERVGVSVTAASHRHQAPFHHVRRVVRGAGA